MNRKRAKIELPTDEEIQEDPLSDFRAPSVETTIISEISSAFELKQEIVIAPGEEKEPLSILSDKFREHLALLHLLPTAKYGYQIESEIPLSPSKYFNQRILHCTHKFAADSAYISFAHSVLQKTQLGSQINIAMKKLVTNNLTAGMMSKNIKQRIKEFIAKVKLPVL